VNCISARIAAAALAALPAAGLLVAVPAAAQTAAAAAPAAATGQARNPNEIICEKQEVVGSRLATRRVCMTRAEWADRKLQDRQEIERVQVQRGSNESGQ
jgi:invasion protein IalB